jgi:hypothetical protein
MTPLATPRTEAEWDRWLKENRGVSPRDRRGRPPSSGRPPSVSPRAHSTVSLPPELDEDDDDEWGDAPISRLSPEELRELERQSVLATLTADPTNGLWPSPDTTDLRLDPLSSDFYLLSVTRMSQLTRYMCSPTPVNTRGSRWVSGD